MPITIQEEHLLDLLEECLPVCPFADAHEIAGRVEFVLETANQLFEIDEESDRD